SAKESVPPLPCRLAGVFCQYPVLTTFACTAKNPSSMLSLSSSPNTNASHGPGFLMEVVFKKNGIPGFTKSQQDTSPPIRPLIEKLRTRGTLLRPLLYAMSEGHR